MLELLLKQVANRVSICPIEHEPLSLSWFVTAGVAGLELGSL